MTAVDDVGAEASGERLGHLGPDLEAARADSGADDGGRARVERLNGRLEDPVRRPLQNGTCSICHDTPNAGNHSVPMALNIGVADGSRRTADLPLYTLRRRATGETVQTTDPGRAMVTGKRDDIGKFKGPVLRALAARPPYFHDGSAATLADVIRFYDTRFQARFTEQEKADLVAFLQAL